VERKPTDPAARQIRDPRLTGVPYDQVRSDQLRNAVFPHLVTLGETLHSWKDEIGCITEGFHNKMETISRVAYGFRNFEN
jgi:transposase